MAVAMPLFLPLVAALASGDLNSNILLRAVELLAGDIEVEQFSSSSSLLIFD